MRTNKTKESRAGFSLHDPVWSLKETWNTNEFWIHVSSIESKVFYLHLEEEWKKKSPAVQPLPPKYTLLSPILGLESVEPIQADMDLRNHLMQKESTPEPREASNLPWRASELPSPASSHHYFRRRGK
jgi:hypothetical protein